MRGLPPITTLCGRTEWWRSNRSGRPEIVGKKCWVGRPGPSSAQVNVQNTDANLGHQARAECESGPFPWCQKEPDPTWNYPRLMANVPLGRCHFSSVTGLKC